MIAGGADSFSSSSLNRSPGIGIGSGADGIAVSGMLCGAPSAHMVLLPLRMIY